VVQKHQATTLHYDFRLEIGGVMPSWAIPKGPTLESSVKWLAMPIDDHAHDYCHFEGVLSEEGYGAGPVMIWDEGTYIPIRESSTGIWMR
jgi:bifunctional non-homologous end joining protein LigD